MSQKETRTKIMAMTAIAVLASAIIAGGSMYAFASDGNNSTSNSTSTTNSGNPTINTKERVQLMEVKIKQALIRDIREHREYTFRGLNTVAFSTVTGVKVLGIVEKSNDTITVTLGHFDTSKTNETSINLSQGAVNQDITIAGIASHFNKDPGGRLSGSNIIKAGWTGTTSVDVKLVGDGNVFGAHLIRVAALPFTGSQ